MSVTQAGTVTNIASDLKTDVGDVNEALDCAVNVTRNFVASIDASPEVDQAVDNLEKSIQDLENSTDVDNDIP